jgi:hypothetical protein
MLEGVRQRVLAYCYLQALAARSPDALSRFYFTFQELASLARCLS